MAGVTANRTGLHPYYHGLDYGGDWQGLSPLIKTWTPQKEVKTTYFGLTGIL